MSLSTLVLHSPSLALGFLISLPLPKSLASRTLLSLTLAFSPLMTGSTVRLWSDWLVFNAKFLLLKIPHIFVQRPIFLSCYFKTDLTVTFFTHFFCIYGGSRRKANDNEVIGCGARLCDVIHIRLQGPQHRVVGVLQHV